ncbi:MAG: T9SS type A sorting domain-containing protein [Bacteroidota bacterium]
MTRLIFTLIYFFPTLLFAQSTASEVINEEWDDYRKAWLTIGKSDRIFDENGNETAYNYSYAKGGEWIPDRNSLTHFSSDGKKIGKEAFEWIDGEKVATFQNIPIDETYDEFGNLLSYIYEVPVFDRKCRVTYEYEEQKKGALLTKKSSQIWEAGEWKKNGEAQYVYQTFAGEKKLIRVLSDNYDSYYRYNEKGQLVMTYSCRSKETDCNGNEGYAEYIYLKNGNTKTIAISGRESSQLRPKKKDITTKNEREAVLHRKSYKWDATTNDWVLDFEVFGEVDEEGRLVRKTYPSCDRDYTKVLEYTYDAHGREKYIYSYEIYDDTTRHLVSRSIFKYFTKVGEDYLVDRPFVLYPNPASTYFSISPNGLSFETAKVVLYDVGGRRVHQEENYQAGEEINIANLQGGLYLVRVEIGEEVFTEKVIISSKVIRP